jgi:hypothetical protein
MPRLAPSGTRSSLTASTSCLADRLISRGSTLLLAALNTCDQSADCLTKREPIRWTSAIGAGTRDENPLLAGN